MTPENKKWESLKAEYIHKVEKALSSVKHPRGKEVLEDVRSHLDRRYSELAPEQRTPENFQSIITEMGPASDYAELLEPQVNKHGQKVQKKQFLIAGIAALVIIAIAISLLVPKSSAVISPTSKIDENGRIVDKIDYPFVNDPDVIGAWKSVDLVETKNDFNPNRKSWNGELWLNHLIFKQDGSVAGAIYTWTKGFVINEGSKTASAYDIKKIGDADYMFFEWKSGDYTIRHEKPCYYVLKRVPLDDVKAEAMFGETAQLPPTSIIDENGRIVDKIDYPFVNDPEAIGAWESVDFVGEIEDFKPGIKSFRGELFLKELFVIEGGKTNWAWSWTKGYLLHSGDKTASKYLVEEIDDETYMFLEWKSGDYVFRHSKPSYYVLKKVPGKPFIESKTTDKIDYPFVEDSDVIGTWKSVDFVEKPDQFRPVVKQWKGDLYLKELVFLPDGKMNDSQDTWTKGLVLNPERKTASRYILEEMDGSTYMFYEWKSGDYTIRGMNPKYYVLKKE